MDKFDKAFDRSAIGTRKWDPILLKEKMPGAKDVIAMDLADIDFECAPAIQQALVERAMQADYSYTYVPDSFYQAVIDWNRRYYGLEIEKHWIRLVFGTVSALHNIVQALTEEGEAVMIQTPAYAPFAEAVQHNGRRLICNDLEIRDNRYYMNFERMEQDIQQEGVKLFILCNPQNPSGRVWTKEELNRLAQICQRHQVCLVSDEIHRDIVFRSQHFTSIWQANEAIMQDSVLCVSPNKGFNLGGLKTSYIVVPNPQLRSRIYKRLSANYVTSPHVFAVPAIVAAYNKERQWLEDMVAYIEENHRLVESYVKEYMPRFEVMPAESSFLVWVRVGDLLETESEVKAFFDACALTVVLGSYFVQNGEGYVRLNIGMQRDKVSEALRRMLREYRLRI